MATFMPPPPAATFLAFHPQDNNIIAIGMDDSTIQIYNVRVDEVKSKLKGHSKRITGLAFSNVLNVLVSSGADAQVLNDLMFSNQELNRYKSYSESFWCLYLSSSVYGTRMGGRNRRARFCKFHREDRRLLFQTRVFSFIKIKYTSSWSMKPSSLYTKQPSLNA